MVFGEKLCSGILQLVLHKQSTAPFYLLEMKKSATQKLCHWLEHAICVGGDNVPFFVVVVHIKEHAISSSGDPS